MLRGLFTAMAFLLLASGTAAKAAEIRVLSLPGIKAPLEELATADAFKRTLLAAKTITYTDGSETGNYVTRMLDRLGIAAEIKPKATLQPGGGRTAPSVARGEAELAIVLVSDILATPGVDLVWPLPAELQNFVVQTAGIGAAARDVAAAKAFIDFLNTAQSGAVFKAKGLEPGTH